MEFAVAANVANFIDRIPRFPLDDAIDLVGSKLTERKNRTPPTSVVRRSTGDVAKAGTVHPAGPQRPQP